MEIKPTEDGVTHINVYSRGRTELGRLLSNFAHTPFTHPKFGEFASVEGFWYWLSLGEQYNELRSLYGHKAKMVANDLKAKGAKVCKLRLFQKYVQEAITCKLEQNPHIYKMLKESSLPLLHYYVYGSDLTNPDKYKIIHLKEQLWITQHLEYLRKN